MEYVDACSRDHLVALDFGIVHTVFSKPLTCFQSLLFLSSDVKVTIKLFHNLFDFIAF